MEVSSHHNKKNHRHVCTSSMNGCGTPGQEEEADDPSNPKATPCVTIGWLAARLWERSPGPTPKGSWRPWDGDQASNSQPLLTWGPPSTRVPGSLSAARTWTARKSTARICTWLTHHPHSLQWWRGSGPVTPRVPEPTPQKQGRVHWLFQPWVWGVWGDCVLEGVPTRWLVFKKR